MPIEIKELHLKFNLDGTEYAGGLPSAAPKPTAPALDPQKWVDQCVEEVLRVLAEKEEER